MVIEEIDISKIVEVENSRQNMKKDHLENLMRSMRDSGLLQPIGVIKKTEDEYIVNFGHRRLLSAKKLGWTSISCSILDNDCTETDFLVTNLVENEHRKEISDIERGRYYFELTQDEHGMTPSEIAVRIGVGRTKVNQCIRLYKEIPDDMKSKVKKSTLDRQKNGEIPVTMANLVLTLCKRLNLRPAQKKELLNYCRYDGANRQTIKSIAELLSKGATFDRAKKQAEKIKFLNVNIPIRKDEYDALLDVHRSVDRVRRHLCMSLYGLADAGVKKPF